MEKTNNTKNCWNTCEACQGRGKKGRRLPKKIRRQYQLDLEEFEKSVHASELPDRPKSQLYVCEDCKGSGLVSSTTFPVPDIENYPHLAIIGAGIGGIALAVACLHRGIPFTIYERDASFDDRSQGYGLTLQQASKAIEGLGIFSLEKGITSTRHLVHTTTGKVIGEWGIRKWLKTEEKPTSKRTNIHIARQALRRVLLEELGGEKNIRWGHQFIDFKPTESNKSDLTFLVDGKIKTEKAELIVGADGIRSSVRNLLFGEEVTPLRYLDCIVILGICALSALEDLESSLLDAATVFQTANGVERIYIMPFDKDSVMWQLSFPMLEEEAKTLSSKGKKALKDEACKRTPWHDPIPQILEATAEHLISGYPVYDREILNPKQFANAGMVTLLGDAAHPMSPFKGQGANQALLDALALARGIFKGCKPSSAWRERGIRESVLTDFETEMIERSAVKVKDSADAAQFLHSEIVLHEGDEPRGRKLKRAEND